MGVAMGWLAVALAASGPGAPPEEPKAEITYRVQMVEVRGLGWRGEGGGLRPVAQHSAVSVWTSPDDFLDRISEESQAVVDGPIVVKGAEQAPVHLTTRKNQAFVTQVVWRGGKRPPKPITENVREGVVATLSGRRLDQGVLAQVVIDDVDVRSVHTIEPGTTKQVADGAAEAPPLRIAAVTDKPCSVTVTVTASMEGDAKPEADADASKSGWLPSKSTAILAQAQPKEEACCEAGAACDGKEKAKAKAKTDAGAARAGWTAAADARIQIPEIGRASAAGEWLIPDGEVLVVGFGPHTIADAEGKAVVRERLAVISAEVSATDDADLAAPTRIEEPAEAPRTAAALPELPSRQLPQGVHSDGTPAPLPVLPEDEEPVATSSDDSEEPRPSPQTRRGKSAPAAAELVTPPAPPADEVKKTDRKAVKSSFSFPPIKNLQSFQPLTEIVGASLLATPFQGAQFLLPLKPLAVKLPFSRKLEFELIGRIVEDPDAGPNQFFAAGN